MLAFAGDSWESSRTFWSLEQSSFVDESADILTAMKVQSTRYKILESSTQTKGGKGPQEGTCPRKSRWHGGNEHMH